jgi:hypothetical protein
MRFLDFHRDVMIAVAAVLAAFGTILGAIVGGLAGSHPNLDVWSNGFMKGAYVCFGLSLATLAALVLARELVYQGRKRKQKALVDFFADGEDFRRRIGKRDTTLQQTELDAWAQRLHDYVEKNLDPAHAVLLGTRHGLTLPSFTSLPSQFADWDSGMTAWLTRLAAYIEELH